MKTIIALLLIMFVFTHSFSQKKIFKKIDTINEKKLKEIKGNILKKDESNPTELNIRVFKRKKIMVYPENNGFVYTDSPTFELYLEAESPYLKGSNRRSSPSGTVLFSENIILTVVQISDDPNWKAEENIVLQEEVLSNVNTVKFKKLSLTINKAYAWNIKIKGENFKQGNMDWNVFYYLKEGTIVNYEEPHLCDSKYIRDPSFKDKSIWRTTNPRFRRHRNVNITSNGHDDSGAGVIKRSNTIIYQELQNTINEGESYQLKFSLKQVKGKTPFKIKVIGFNGKLNSLNPSKDIAIMTLSGTIPYNKGWNKITLSSWKSHNTFKNIALVFMPEPKSENRISLLIDRVCLTNVKTTCQQNNLPYGVKIPERDESITVTNQNYLVGTVQDLYPNYDTSTADWYAEMANDCLSIGGHDSEEDEIQPDKQDEEFKDDQKQLINLEEELMSNEPLFYLHSREGIKPFARNEKSYCDKGKEDLDPEKPFGGRDIVYIHGLQSAALSGNFRKEKTFQGKWPDDKRDFYHGGEFNNEARASWSGHFRRGLGRSNTPTNSFLVVSYSSNQRLEIGIHAVLTQIKDAIKYGINKEDMSREHKRSGRCFGDKGIVVITHSTGGLLASAMFGIAERSHIDKDLNEYYGDVRFITDKIDAQIGFNAAYGGSPLATACIGAIFKITNSKLINYVNENFLDSVDIDLNPDFNPINSILYDLMPSVSRDKWRPLMSSGIPTLIMTGTTTGRATDNRGNLMIKGFDDSVSSASSQSSHIKIRPRFKVKNRGKLVDKGAEGVKRRSLIRMSKSGNYLSIRDRNYYLTPYLSPTGMLQGNSVKSVVDNPAELIKNHFTVLQTTGNHFDNVSDVYHNGNNYTAKRGLNNEETGVVFDSQLYTRGLLSNDFKRLNQERIKRELWGFHAPKITLVRKCIRIFRKKICLKIPKVTWHYYEYIKWQRKYHLLKGYKTKKGVDYMYQYILR